MSDISVVTLPADAITERLAAMEAKLDRLTALLRPSAKSIEWLSANGFRNANHIGQPKLERLVAQKKVERLDFGGYHGMRYRWKP